MRGVLAHRCPPGRRARRLALAGVALGALIVTTGVVWESAHATWTDAAPTVATTLTTGSIAIGDDDAGTALFAVSRLKPGAAGTRCIKVTSTGNVPAPVRLYVTGRSSTKSLTSTLTLSIQTGSGGSSGNCAGFTPAATVYRGTLAAFPTGFGSGIGDWTTTGNPAGESRTYQITYRLPSNASSTSQGGTATAAFTWEAQSR